MLGPKFAGSSFGVLTSCKGIASAIGPVLIGIASDWGAMPVRRFTVAVAIEMLCIICARVIALQRNAIPQSIVPRGVTP